MKKERQLVLAKTNGRCAYCGVDLTGIKWHIDHIEPVFRKSTYNNSKCRYESTGEMRNAHLDTYENKFAACPSCNNYKSTFSLEMFRSELSKIVQRLNSHQTTYRIAKRFGLIEEIQKPIVFYFETIR